MKLNMKTQVVSKVLKIGLQSNKINAEIKIQKNANKIETQIYVVHPIWATSTEKLPVLSFISSNKLK